MSALVNLMGQVFCRLSVVERAGSDRHKKALWRCVCTCGNETVVIGSGLIKGDVRSCGCLKSEEMSLRFTKHGQAKNKDSRTAEYKIWLGMNNRCSNPNFKDWHLYGGRGIEVCKEWQESFEAFFKYVGLRPNTTMSIDRYPNLDGNYEPGNVRWATPLEQVHNRREKTHCKRGHELTDDNSYIDKRHGGRSCRTCHIEAQREYDKHRPKRDYTAERENRERVIPPERVK
jgi:hypothetical protein